MIWPVTSVVAIRMAESEEKPKSLLLRVKEESEKACLKLNIQKNKIMASSLIISWQIDQKIGRDWKQWQILCSKAPKSLQMLTAAMMKLKDACSLKEKL